MPKGITGSGGVDTSALDGLVSKLESVLDAQQQINETRVSPKTDDTEVRSLNKQITDLKNNVNNTQRTKLELWDTKSVQKDVNKATDTLEKFAKSFDMSKISPINLTGAEKEFLKFFAILKEYSNQFGQELSSTYQNIFDKIFNSGDTWKKEDITALVNKYTKEAADTIKMNMGGIQSEANENLIRKQTEALKAEQAEAKRAADAVSEAERRKRAEYMETRDKMVNDIKTAFDEIRNTAKDGEYLNIDEQSWGILQQKVYDLTQLMSSMGFEVRDIEDAFAQLQNKVYIPADQIENARNNMRSAATEAEGMVTEIDQMSGALSSVDDSRVEKLQRELEVLRDAYHRVCSEAWELEKANKQMYSSDEYAAVSGAASEYWMQLEKLKEEFTELQQKYNAIINTGNSGENALSKTFDINNADKFVDILTQISQHLNDIKNTLGTVDDTNGFTNIINSVDILLEKLDEVRVKVGTGINNITINQGVDKTAQEQSAATSDYLRSTMSRYKNAYSKVSSAAGGEEKLFAYINSAINFKGGIDQLYKTYGSSNVSEIQTAEGQIYRLIDFFKVLREAMASEEFGLNLSGIRLPSSDDSNFRAQLRKKSGLNKSNEEVLDLEDEKINLTEITDKLEEIKTILSEISQKDLFGDSLNRVSQKLDEIVGKFNNIVAKVEIINDTPLITDNQNQTPISETKAEETANEVQQATEAVEAEGNAAQEASEKKEKFAQANKKVADSATTTATATKQATDKIKAEGNAAQEASEQIEEAESALERYIRNQRGEADSGNYDYTQAINQVTDKRVRVRTDENGNVQTSETLIVNYDKLSKRLVSTDTEILKLQQQIRNTTQGNTQGLRDNLQILEDERDVYERLLAMMVQEPEYEIDQSQVDILQQQRDRNEEFVRNMQATQDSITQLRQNQQTASLGLDVGIKSRELEDYVEKLRELGIYTPQVEQEVLGLGQALSQVTTRNGLSDWTKQFSILKSDMSSTVEEASIANNIQLQSRALEDYVAELRELGVYTPQVEQEAIGLSNALSQVTTSIGLKDWIEQFKIFKSDMASTVDSVPLSGKIQLQSRELDDYVAELKELGIYTPQVQQEVSTLFQSLSQVISTKGLSNWINQFKILKSDMVSTVKGTSLKLDVGLKSRQLDDYVEDLKRLNVYTPQVEQEVKRLYKALSQVTTTQGLSNWTKQFSILKSDVGTTVDSIQTDFNNVISKYQEIKTLNKDIQSLLNAGVSSDKDVITDRQSRITDLKREISLIDQTRFSTEQLNSVKKIEADIDKVENDAQAKRLARGAQEQQQIDKTRNSLLQQASALKSNGKLMKAYGSEVDGFIKELQNTGVTKERLEEIRVALMNIKTEANLTGQSGKTFGQILKQRFTSLGAYLSTFTSFYRVISYIRQGFDTILDLDTQLVDLRKTTTMTTSELNQFYNASSDVAKQLGVTTSEIISQASAWSRLGYSSKEAATEMAQLSSKFASISPGMTTENSTDYLVSTMQAYGIAVDDVERKILDNVNRIGNTFATTNAEIGEMLTRSSAAMKAANNSLEETIALESAAVQITRNAETTGTAFRTISMRIRGYDEETEELSEDLQNISGDIADLTKVGGKGGISIFTDASRTEYKSTYEILKEIAGIWDDLTDKQQADLLEKLGGESFATRYRNIFYRTHLIARTA